MALRDLEAFIRQRAADYDSSLDANPGSPFDAKVIQPILRRNGLDPFTVDLLTFATARLKQLYPNLATDDGDNLTDLLIKPAALLWDPVVREIVRVKRGLSFADPSTLTLEEADSLGGNFFVPRRRGNRALGPARIFFASPQDVTITQNNFVTSRGDLVFFPTEVQSIRSQEMLQNVDSEGLYYFDINVIAANAGDGYNIGPNELVSIANVPSAVRVRNLRRFRFGAAEEDAVEYSNRIQSSLGEKSMNTLRGIAAKVLDSFPEVQRLNVVGFGDPEMQRDVIKGGGLGAPIAGGVAGTAVSDAENELRSRRFYTTEVDFQVLVGLSAENLVLSLINPGGANNVFDTAEVAQDLNVLNVIDSNTLDLEDQVLIQGASSLPWTLRRKELTISDIPGGILFPDSANGTVDIPNDEVHIGGAHDIHIRATDFDDATLTIEAVNDDTPLLNGVQGVVTGTTQITLSDIALDVDYTDDDQTYTDLEEAGIRGYSIQIQDGPNAGTYRIVSVSQVSLFSPILTVAETLPLVEATERRWRMFDVINVDLVEPRETRLTDDDLITTQGVDTVTTVAGTNFDTYGVTQGDVLRILEGPEAGDYDIIADPIAPSYDFIQLDRPFPRTLGATKYTIFRANAGAIERPLVRIKSIELLDASSQPQGSFIPYAHPVDIQSRAFQNPARGVKHDFSDAILGIVSVAAVGGVFTGLSAASHTLSIAMFSSSGTTTELATIPGPFPTLASVLTALNTSLETLTGSPNVAVQIDDNRIGIRPAGSGVLAIIGGNARIGLFGNNEFRTTADIRVDSVTALTNGWQDLDPAIDAVTGLDVVQIVDGFNTGFYGGPFLLSPYFGAYPAATQSKALVLADSIDDVYNGTNVEFLAPEYSRRVKVGARSLGSVRVFFLEPTSFEVDANTVFELDTGETGIAKFLPDPTLSHQQIPSLPDGDTPTDGSSSDGLATFTSLSQDFILSGIRVGDTLTIETFPLTGDVVLSSSTVVGLVGTTFVFSLEGGPDRTLIFIRDDTSIGATEVTRNGVINQINALAGETIAQLDGSNRIKFSTSLSLVIRSSGTSLPLILGNILGYTPTKAFSTADVNNASPHAGEYDIIGVPTSTTLTVSPGFPAVAAYASPITEQTFKVERDGVQRISTSQMADNQTDGDLYYFDVELISEGTGDFWNIGSDLQMTATGYRSDGYYLVTDDENLTFSELEPVRLVLSRTILEEGVDDDPQNATQITGQNLLIRYDRSQVVEDVQSFAVSDFERAVAANPLTRHLIPHFVRFDVTYFGGSEESIILDDLEQYVKDLYPVDTLDASAVQKIISARGATRIINPLTLLAVVHYTDRTIYLQRSEDNLSTGRLSAFIPDVLNVTRRVS